MRRQDPQKQASMKRDGTEGRCREAWQDALKRRREAWLGALRRYQELTYSCKTGCSTVCTSQDRKGPTRSGGQ